MRRLSERILSAERVERVRERVREAINQDEAANMAVTFAVKEKNKRILALEKERKLLLEKHRTLQATASALASAVRAKDEELQSTQRFSKGVVSDLGEAKEALQTRVDALSAPQQPHHQLVDLLGDDAPSLPPPQQQHHQRQQLEARETAVALEVLTHLLTENNEPAIRITPPMPGPEMDRDTAEQLLEGFESVRDSVDERAYGAAAEALMPGSDCASFEAPTVIRYRPGQRLAPHFDANRGADVEDANRGGQTLATLLLYLNDVDAGAGGVTRFGRLNLEVTPRRGQCLVFFPAAEDGTFDDRVEHEGTEATEEKWICRIWRHEREVPPPFGLPVGYRPR